MNDDEFKIIVSSAIVSLEQQFGGLRNEVTGLRNEVTGLRNEVTGFKQEFTEFKHEVNSKLDGIGAFLISSDKSHIENSHRISLLENRVQKLEDDRRQESA